MRYLAVFFLFSCLQGYAQSTTHYQFFVQAGTPVDSTQLLNLDQKVNLKARQPAANAFSFRTNYPDFYRLLVYTAKQRYQTMLWLDPGKASIYLRINANELMVDSVAGSRTYQLAEETNIDLHATQNPEEKSTLLLTAIQQNKANPLALGWATTYVALNRNQKDKLVLLRPILLTMNDTVQSHLFYEEVWSQITILLETKKIEIDQYPFYDRRNNQTFITPAKQGFILLDFWFTACLPCVEQHEVLKEQQEYLRAKKVQLIGISIDKDFKKWEAYLNKKELNWPNYRTIQTGREKIITEDLKITAFPTYFILNSEKEILASFHSFAEVKTFLDARK